MKLDNENLADQPKNLLLHPQQRKRRPRPTDAQTNSSDKGDPDHRPNLKYRRKAPPDNAKPTTTPGKTDKTHDSLLLSAPTARRSASSPWSPPPHRFPRLLLCPQRSSRRKKRKPRSERPGTLRRQPRSFYRLACLFRSTAHWIPYRRRPRRRLSVSVSVSGEAFRQKKKKKKSARRKTSTRHTQTRRQRANGGVCCCRSQIFQHTAKLSTSCAPKQPATPVTHRCCSSCGPLSSPCRLALRRLFFRCAPRSPARTCHTPNTKNHEIKKPVGLGEIRWGVAAKGRMRLDLHDVRKHGRP